VKITPRDKFWIDGRGQVFVVHPDDNPGIDLQELLHETVEIEEKSWKVVGVESFLIKSRHIPVGLLVRPL